MMATREEQQEQQEEQEEQQIQGHQEQDDEGDDEARHHKRVSAAWRDGLHALAQNLKCPICLGYVKKAHGRHARTHPR